MPRLVFREGDILDPAGLVTAVREGVGPLAGYVDRWDGPEARAWKERLRSPEVEPEAVPDRVLLDLVNSAVRAGVVFTPGQPGTEVAAAGEAGAQAQGVGTKQRKVKAAPMHAGYPELLKPNSDPRRRLQRLILQVLGELKREQKATIAVPELLEKELPARKQVWLSAEDLVLAREALADLGRAGLIYVTRTNGDLAVVEAVSLTEPQADAQQAEARLNEQPVTPAPLPAKERRWYLVLLVLDLIGLWLLYIRFLPSELKVEFNAFNAWLTGIAGLVGLQVVRLGTFWQPMMDGPGGRYLRMSALSGTVPILFLVVGTLAPVRLSVPPGAKITVAGHPRLTRQTPEAATGASAPNWVHCNLWLPWGTHDVTVTKPHFVSARTGAAAHTETIETTWKPWEQRRKIPLKAVLNVQLSSPATKTPPANVAGKGGKQGAAKSPESGTPRVDPAAEADKILDTLMDGFHYDDQAEIALPYSELIELSTGQKAELTLGAHPHQNRLGQTVLRFMLSDAKDAVRIHLHTIQLRSDLTEGVPYHDDVRKLRNRLLEVLGLPEYPDEALWDRQTEGYWKRVAELAKLGTQVASIKKQSENPKPNKAKVEKNRAQLVETGSKLETELKGSARRSEPERVAIAQGATQLGHALKLQAATAMRARAPETAQKAIQGLENLSFLTQTAHLGVAADRTKQALVEARQATERESLAIAVQGVLKAVERVSGAQLPGTTGDRVRAFQAAPAKVPLAEVAYIGNLTLGEFFAESKDRFEPIRDALWTEIQRASERPKLPPLPNLSVRTTLMEIATYLQSVPAAPVTAPSTAGSGVPAGSGK